MPTPRTASFEYLKATLTTLGCTLERRTYGPPINDDDFRIIDALGNLVAEGDFELPTMREAYQTLTGEPWRG